MSYTPMSFEDQIGGRVLAWVGGAAVVLGLCFMLAIAVSTGLLGEAERTVLAAAASLALLAGRRVGAWTAWPHGRLAGRGRRRHRRPVRDVRGGVGRLRPHP
jgi:hypothetical protein